MQILAREKPILIPLHLLPFQSRILKQVRQRPREGEGAGGSRCAPLRSRCLLQGWGRASGTALWGTPNIL